MEVENAGNKALKQNELLKQLEKISKGMNGTEEEKMESFYLLRKISKETKFEMDELSGALEPKVVFGMWLLDSFIDMLLANFGYDNIGYPKEKASSIIKIITLLGKVIENLFFGEGKITEPFTAIFEEFYSLIRFCNKEFENKGYFSNNDHFVL